MRCIIVDDDRIFREYFREILYSCAKTAGMTMSIDSSGDVEKVICSSVSYDIYFIDIEMPEVNGFEVIRRLRDYYINAEFVIVSGHENYMQQAFYVKPSAFIRKSRLEEDTKETLDHIKFNVCRREGNVAIYEGRKKIKIQFDTLVYCYSDGHFVDLFFEKNDKKVVRTKIDVLKEKLHPLGFVKIHRRCLVNLKYVCGIQGRVVSLYDGKKLSVSKRRQKEVKLMVENWVLLHHI